jgi:hypothetical protein
MTASEIIHLLGALERRLATIADQAAETLAQAQHTRDRVERLRRELGQLKAVLTSTADTAEHTPLQPTSGR